MSGIIKGNHLLTVIYSHPEAYPPTLNALEELSKIYNRISVLYRPTLPLKWPYANNIKLQASGAEMTSREQETLPLIRRIKLFITFSFHLFKLCKKEQPSVVLLYDPLSVLAYSITQIFGLHSHTIWYHNHDVLEAGQKRFSLNWWAIKAEKRLFPKLDIFTLPAEERKEYFPMNQFKGKYFFLPNQPSASFYRQYQSIKKSDKTCRIIFQGHIDRGHGIEEILDLLPMEINGRAVHLILKGWVRDEYKDTLQKLINKKGIQENVEFVGYTAYQELPKLTASCHIGIAIHTKTDIMNRTLGTASNKIYEYAAVGLPVLYFNNEHFIKHLGKFKWAVPTDMTKQSLINAIKNIVDNFDTLSLAAQQDFINKLSFELHFRELENHLKNKPAHKKEKLIAVA